MRMITKRGYDLGEVASAMQKAIRRAETRLAGYRRRQQGGEWVVCPSQFMTRSLVVT